jgi:hypothetical protein
VKWKKAKIVKIEKFSFQFSHSSQWAKSAVGDVENFFEWALKNEIFTICDDAQKSSTISLNVHDIKMCVKKGCP